MGADRPDGNRDDSEGQEATGEEVVSEEDGSDGRFGALFAGGTVVFLGIVIHLGTNFFAKLLVARVLGSVGLGAVALGYTLLTTTTVFVLVGTDVGVGRYLPRYEAVGARRGVLLSAFRIVLPLAVVVGGAIALAAGPIARHVFTDPSLAPILRVFGIAVPLAAVLKLTVGSVRGNKEALPRVYIQNVGLPVSRLALVAVALLASLGALGVAWAYLGSYLVAAVLSIRYLARRTSLFAAATPEPMGRELLVFSAPLMVTATTSVLFSNVDTFLVGYFATTGAVGVYTVAYTLARLLEVVLNAFGFVFMPTISELHAEHATRALRRTYEVVSKWIFLATLPLFFLVVSYPGPTIRYTFGAEYVAGELALSILAVGFLTHAVAGPSGNTLIAIGRQRIVMYANVSVVVVNVVLNVVLVPRYGILGAAVATTIGYAVMNGIYLVSLYAVVGIHPFRPAILLPAGIATALWGATSLAVRPLTPTLPVLVAVVAAFVVGYLLIVVWFGGIEQEDVEILETIEDRLGRKLGIVRRIATFGR